VITDLSEEFVTSKIRFVKLSGFRNGASRCEEAHCGQPRGRASLLGTVGYKRKALGCAALFMRAHLENLDWDFLPGTLRDGSNGLWRWDVSLYGRSVKGVCREDSLTREPGV
jgi:hypothetical protein